MPITTWSRLEPDIETADPLAGVELGLTARTADPLWLLARQQALGELRLEDCGMPVAAKVLVASHAATQLRVQGEARPVRAGVPWEAEVEAESNAVDLRLRLRGGELFVALLAEHGLSSAIERAIEELPWPEVATGSATERALVRAAARRWPDGEAVAAAIADNQIASLLAVAPDSNALSAATKSWRDWWRPRARVDVREAWRPERLEHEFAVEVPTTTGTLTLAAQRHAGDRLDWDAFEYAGNNVAATVPALTVVADETPVPLTVPGMPAMRFWELEDETFDPGRISFGPGDLGAALLVETALAYAGDWFVVPAALAAGALHRVTGLTVTDSFGVQSTVRSVEEVRPEAGWALWQLSGAGPRALFVPCATATTLLGEVLEEVVLVRDELANAGWAIERAVEDGLGRGRPVNAPAAPASAPASKATWAYRPLPSLPGDRIPLVRRAASDGARLHRAGVVDPSMGIPESQGRLVTPTFAVHEAELDRVGVVVTRRWQVTQDANGQRLAWCSRIRAPAGFQAGVRVAFDELAEVPPVFAAPA